MNLVGSLIFPQKLLELYKLAGAIGASGNHASLSPVPRGLRIPAPFCVPAHPSAGSKDRKKVTSVTLRIQLIAWVNMEEA